jgi:hypothetical protein
LKLLLLLFSLPTPVAVGVELRRPITGLGALSGAAVATVVVADF